MYGFLSFASFFVLLIPDHVHHPGQHQPCHHDEQGPEHSLHLLILPEHPNRRIHVGMRPALHRAIPRAWSGNVYPPLYPQLILRRLRIRSLRITTMYHLSDNQRTMGLCIIQPTRFCEFGCLTEQVRSVSHDESVGVGEYDGCDNVETGDRDIS